MRSSLTRSMAWGVAGLGLMFNAGAAGAQPATPDEERAQRREEARGLVVEAIRERLVRPAPEEAIERDARALVRSLSAQQVDDLLRGDGLETVRAATATATSVTAAAEDGEMQQAVGQALGDAESELLFVPLAPCRIIDTRVGGGKLAAGETRHFLAAGTTGFPAQGGKSGGCGVPQGASTPQAAAVMVNLVAVDPNGKGNMAAWEYGQPAPLASSINFQAIDMNIANGLIVPIAGVGTQPFDLSVKASFSAVHLVADVTGYFTRFPVENFQNNLKSTVVNSDFTTLIDMSDGACKELNTCTVTTSEAGGRVIVEAWGQFVVNHTGGTLDRVVIGVETGNPVTCGYSETSADASDFEVSAALGSNPDVDFTVSHGKSFAQPVGVTRTYRLSGRVVSGASSGDSVENSRLICTFIPD